MTGALSITIADADPLGSNVALLTALVNRVYAAAEADLWAAGATRTTETDMAAMIGWGEIAAARLDGELVGSVRVRLLAPSLGGFGMLCADPAHRGAGLGLALVRFAEDRCRDDGATTMQLELLVPRQWRHEGKAQLHDWYSRLGYREVGREPAREALGSLGALLVTPCDLVTYQRPLG